MTSSVRTEVGTGVDVGSGVGVGLGVQVDGVIQRSDQFLDNQLRGAIGDVANSQAQARSRA